MKTHSSVSQVAVAVAITLALLISQYACTAQEAVADSVVSESGIEIPVFLEPYRSIEISSVETGVIGEILVREGERVKAGQELLKLDLDVLEAQLAVADAQAKGKGRVMAAQADFDLNDDRLKKLEALGGSGRVNEAEIAKQRAVTTSSMGLLLAAQEEAKVFELSAMRIQAEIERRILRSPIDGVVVEIVKDVAEAVSTARAQPGEPDFLVRVVRLEELKTTAYLPHEKVRHLKVGDTLVIRTETVSGDTTNVTGYVEFVSPILKSSTEMVAVNLKIDNSALQLRGGTAAKLLLDGGKE